MYGSERCQCATAAARWRRGNGPVGAEGDFHYYALHP